MCFGERAGGRGCRRARTAPRRAGGAARRHVARRSTTARPRPAPVGGGRRALTAHGRGGGGRPAQRVCVVAGDGNTWHRARRVRPPSRRGACRRPPSPRCTPPPTGRVGGGPHGVRDKYGGGARCAVALARLPRSASAVGARHPTGWGAARGCHVAVAAASAALGTTPTPMTRPGRLVRQAVGVQFPLDGSTPCHAVDVHSPLNPSAPCQARERALPLGPDRVKQQP